MQDARTQNGKAGGHRIAPGLEALATRLEAVLEHKIQIIARDSKSKLPKPKMARLEAITSKLSPLPVGGHCRSQDTQLKTQVQWVFTRKKGQLESTKSYTHICAPRQMCTQKNNKKRAENTHEREHGMRL